MTSTQLAPPPLHPDDSPPPPATRKAALQYRRDRVMTLLVEGCTVVEIARQLDVTPTQVNTAMTQALKEASAHAPSVNQYKEIHHQRVAELLNAWWEPAKTSEIAFDRVLKLMEREARLLGLDAPLKRELTGKDGGPIQANVDLTTVSTDDIRELRDLILREGARVIEGSAQQVEE